MPLTDARTIGEMVRLACIMEVCAPKAGNVHPGARFVDVTHEDFIASACAIAPILNRAPSQSVGGTIHQCVKATLEVAGTNTNLGIILLLTPLCTVPHDCDLFEQLPRVLDSLSVEDAAMTYDAIRMAKPGGLGRVEDADVRQVPSITLKQAMALAADRDAVAMQYVNGFRDVQQVADDLADESIREALPLRDHIVLAHLRQMARLPDSLIRRKCGDALAKESSQRAQAVIDAGWPREAESVKEFAALDAWLRGDGHRRNPGTSADLVAAGLFVALRQRRLRLDSEWLAEWAT